MANNDPTLLGSLGLSTSQQKAVNSFRVILEGILGKKLRNSDAVSVIISAVNSNRIQLTKSLLTCIFDNACSATVAESSAALEKIKGIECDVRDSALSAIAAIWQGEHYPTKINDMEYMLVSGMLGLLQKEEDMKKVSK